MSFEWRTDENDDWPEGEESGKTAVGGENSAARWQSRWRLWLTVLLGIAAVWAVVQWQIDMRVTAATSEIETELLATHNFVLNTAVSQDEQLFRTILSGRNPDWGEVQKTLLSDGLLLDRPMFGWQQMVQPRLLPADVSLQLSPDLRAAELIYPQTYVVQTPTGITETVTLQQTAVYRQGNTRWLYAPPYDEFWGDWVINSGKNLTLVYPARDADVAERLAANLETLLEQMCAQLDGLNCGDGLRLNVRLDTDPDSLLGLNEVETILSGSLRLNLPTPTLVGLPTDEQSYQALYRAYGVRMATAVFANQAEYDCCRRQLFFRALRDYQLAELGLQAWPIDEAAYGRALSSGFSGNAGRQWSLRWEDDSPEVQQVYFLVEYLMTQETAVSPIEMMTRLMDGTSYQGWASTVSSGNYESDLFATQFVAYIYAQSTAGQQAEPPLPLPSGTITLICNDFSSNSDSGVYQYNLASGEWIDRFQLASNDHGNLFTNSVDGRRFLISNYQFSNNETNIKVSLLTEDGEILLEDTQFTNESEFQGLNYYFVDRAGDYFVRTMYGEGEQETTLRATDCPTDACPELQLSGWPLFSPEGNYFLKVDFDTDIFTTANENPYANLVSDLSILSLDLQTNLFVERGGWPFWLNESTIGYWRLEDEKVELVTAVLPQNEPRTLLNMAELLDTIPPDERPDMIFPIFSIVNPQNPQELLLPMRDSLDFSSNNTQRFLFKLSLTADLATVEKIELLSTGSANTSFDYSPDGRYITYGSINNIDNSSTWFLLDQMTGETSDPITTQAFGLSWSPDGQWFVQNNDTYLLLRAPAYDDYQYVIPHSLVNCQQIILSADE
jgi:WD40-like Beta Propeller Repeat